MGDVVPTNERRDTHAQETHRPRGLGAGRERGLRPDGRHQGRPPGHPQGHARRAPGPAHRAPRRRQGRHGRRQGRAPGHARRQEGPPPGPARPAQGPRGEESCGSVNRKPATPEAARRKPGGLFLYISIHTVEDCRARLRCNARMKPARRALGAAAAILLLPIAACSVAPLPSRPANAPAEPPAGQLLLLERVSWGANRASLSEIQSLGSKAWLERQLDPRLPEALPPQVQAQIDAMEISRRSVPDLIEQFRGKRKEAKDDPEKRKALQQELNGLAREAATRSLLRAVYSPRQLESQMTWFW